MKKSIFSELPPPSPPLPPPPPPPAKISRRKLYIVVGLVAVVAIAAILMVSPLPPSGREKISLIFNFRKGENMTYRIKIRIEAQGNISVSFGDIYMKVLDFDGENYTVYYRIGLIEIGEISLIVKVNRQGEFRESIVGKLPTQDQYFLITGMGSMILPGLGSSFPKTEAVVGEEIQSSLFQDMPGVNGTIKMRFSEITTKTFTNIGEFKVFKVNFSVDVSSSSQIMMGTVSINGYAYYEYNTCLLIEYSAQGFITEKEIIKNKTTTGLLFYQLNLTNLNRPA